MHVRETKTLTPLPAKSVDTDQLVATTDSASQQLPMVETTVGCIEMRTAERFRILQRCFVYPADVSAPQPWQCIAYNISLTGIGVGLPIEMPKGTVLTIKPFGLPQACPREIRIVHARQTEMLWFTGCEFVNRLSEPELRIWLSGPLNWVDYPDT
jgi:PilZ domain